MKWKPSKSMRRDFARRMQDPEEKTAYEARKQARDEKRRSASRFDYESAGGSYVPTKAQYDYAMSRPDDLTIEQQDACNQVVTGYACNEKVSHDDIHIINELIRRKI